MPLSLTQGSLTVEELVASVKGSSSSSARSTPLKELERVVFIDSTWSQSRGMCIVSKEILQEFASL